MGILDKVVAAGKKVAGPADNEAAGLAAKSDTIKQYMDATKPAAPKTNTARPVSSVDKVNNPPHKSRISAADAADWSKPLGSFAKGTTKVKKDQVAVVHKGEAIIPAHENPVNGGTFDLTKSLAGKEPEKPKKEIKHIKTSKAKSGGFIHEHVHTHPEVHPDETHVTADQDAMADHMMQHMGEPNPGEAEAEAGESGAE